jgi:hypothetical protein
MSDTQIKSVALFFFFAFFDEHRALDLTSKTLKLVRKKARDSQLDTNALIVKISQKVFLKEAGRQELPPPPQDLNIFQIPEAVHLGHLHALRKRVTAEEYGCLLWIKVFGLSETTVATGLDTTIGTIRHRTSQALKALGRHIPHEEAQA